MLLTVLLASFAFATTTEFTCVGSLYPGAAASPDVAKIVSLARTALSPTLGLVQRTSVVLEPDRLSREEWRAMAENVFQKLAPNSTAEAAFVFDAFFAEASRLRLPLDRKPRFHALQERLRMRRARVTEGRSDTKEVIDGLFDDRPDYDLIQFDIFREIAELRPFRTTFREAMLVLFKDFELAQTDFPCNWREWTTAVDLFVGREFAAAPTHVKRFFVHALETFFLRIPRVNEAVLARELLAHRARPQIAPVAPKKAGPIPSVRIRETEATAASVEPARILSPTDVFPDASQMKIADIEPDQIHVVPFREGMRLAGSDSPYAFFEISSNLKRELTDEVDEPFDMWLKSLQSGTTTTLMRRGISRIKVLDGIRMALHDPVLNHYVSIERREVRHPDLGRISVLRWTEFVRKSGR